MIVPKQPVEDKKAAFRILKDMGDALYPDSPEMRKNYVRLSKSLRKVLRAFETIMESPDLDNLDFKENLDDVLARLDEAPEGTKEFEKALEELNSLPRNSIQKLTESENEQTRKAMETLKEELPNLSDSLTSTFERLFRVLVEPAGLEEIIPKFPKLERTEDEG